jgi:hypothetical protein
MNHISNLRGAVHGTRSTTGLPRVSDNLLKFYLIGGELKKKIFFSAFSGKKPELLSMSSLTLQFETWTTPFERPLYRLTARSWRMVSGHRSQF